MKRLLFLLFLVPAIAWGQLPARKELRDFKKEYRELKKEFDVVLDPISQIPAEVYPDSYEAQESGNWGNVALETDKYFDQIVARSKRRIHVYVLDTDGKGDHPALKFVIQPGATFTGETDPTDGNGHGTHCEAIIGGVAEFPLGVARALIEKENLFIYPVKVLNNSGAGSYSAIEKAILWANEAAKKHIQAGDFVIYSMSLGGTSVSSSVTAALVAAEKIGVLTVAAAGNSGGRGVNFPGSSAGAKAIAALKNTNPLSRAAFSTFGPEVWLAMPGESILSAYKNGTYATLSGTSMATPHAAGIAAIAASVYPTFNALQIVTLLEKVATDIAPTGRDEHTGYGVDLIGAILNYSGGTPTPDPKPEPPKPVEPVKPIREQLFGFSEPFTVLWGRQGSNDWQEIRFTIDVAWKNTKVTPTSRKAVNDFLTSHFTRRGYYLFPDSDEQDALYWISYFLEMLAKKEAGLIFDVTQIREVEKPNLILNDPIPGKPAGNASYKARVVTFLRQ